VELTTDGSVNCGSAGYDPIDYTVSCATCTNPQVDFQLIDDCVNAPQFFVEADVLDLGSATDLDITDNQGSPAQTVSATGVVSFGPYPNGTPVVLTVTNNQDANCEIDSQELTQDFCTTTVVDCTAGPVNETICYGDNENLTLDYVSSDGTPLNLVFNSGFVETFFDSIFVFDSDGSILFDGDGDLSGLFFQSSGDTITVQLTTDGSVNCSSAGYDPIDYTVSCATCINPDVEYFVVGDCDDEDSEAFSIEVEILDLGSATSLDITNNQGDPLQNVSTPSTLTFGPYPLGTNVVFTVENVDDANCTLVSPNQTLISCGCFGADPFCAPDEGEALIFENVSDGSSAPPGIDYDCLGSQPDPVWFFLQIEESGDLDFEIVQNTQFDAVGNPTGAPLDVDFIAWGPFDNTQDACNDLSQNTQVGCSFSAAPIENFSITNAQEGEIYIVLITNFDGAPGFISLGQTNTGSPGSGSTDCDIVLQNQVVGCEGDNITLTADDTAADQFQWLVFNEATQEFDPIIGEDQVSTTVTASGLYQVLTLNGSEVSTEEFDVSLTPVPEHNLPMDVSLCGSAQVTIDASVLNPTDYDLIAHEWLFNGTVIPGANGATHDATQPGTYSVIITTTQFDADTDGNDLLCTNQFDVQVALSDFTVDLGGNQNYCSTQIETINVTVDGEDASNATYLWSTGEDTASIDVDTTGIYEITVTIDGCPVTESVIYTFAEEPQFSLGADLNLCEEESTVLDASVANASDFTNVTYQWSDDDGVLVGEINPSLVVTTEGNYSVVVTTTTTTSDGVDFDCTSSDTVFVNVTEFSVDLGEDQTFCDAEPQIITAVIDGEETSAATYLWNTGETTESILVSDSGVYEVTVTIDECPVEASVEYTFNESPIIALGPDSQTCDLLEFTLDATPSNFIEGNVNYTWTLDGTDLDQNTPILNPDDFGFGTYQVTVFFDDPDCNTVDDITLSLRDDIGVSITSDDVDNLFCVNETATFNASLQNADIIEADFQWFVNDQPEGDNSPTLESYEITSSETSQDVRVEVSIGASCFVSDVLSISLYDVDNCVISQGLSPNEDGDNDNLDLRFLDDRSGIVSLEVFNRYGQLVYEKTNYRNEFFGQSDNGNTLETGTYFYVIKFENEDEVYGRVHKGWIYINQEQ
jgi:gliding motility-associated-like protein